MVIIAGLCVLLAAGLVLAIRFSGTEYEPLAPDTNVARRYLRGVAVGLVAGFWTGALVTGPAMRLVMRLLAVTAGDGAQGKVTEADQVVGAITFDGTLGLVIFGGIFPGLLSGFLYVALRALLPRGRWAGVVFGLLHLVVAATRIDPLRPDNVDFDLVGPAWLALVTFGGATVVHGVAVVGYANRYSHELTPGAWADRPRRWRLLAPLVPAALFLVPGVFLVLPLAAGLLVAALLSQVAPLARAVRSPAALLAGRLVVGAVALVFLPGAIDDLVGIVA